MFSNSPFGPYEVLPILRSQCYPFPSCPRGRFNFWNYTFLFEITIYPTLDVLAVVAYFLILQSLVSAFVYQRRALALSCSLYLIYKKYQLNADASFYINADASFYTSLHPPTHIKRPHIDTVSYLQIEPVHFSRHVYFMSCHSGQGSMKGHLAYMYILDIMHNDWKINIHTSTVSWWGARFL